MFLEDKLRERLPRDLRQIEIWVWDMPRLDWESALAIFSANGRSVEFEVDPEAGLTDERIAQLCVTF
jgi:hypothetical protein